VEVAVAQHPKRLAGENFADGLAQLAASIPALPVELLGAPGHPFIVSELSAE
jgi:hypothetical protein